MEWAGHESSFLLIGGFGRKAEEGVSRNQGGWGEKKRKGSIPPGTRGVLKCRI